VSRIRPAPTVKASADVDTSDVRRDRASRLDAEGDPPAEPLHAIDRTPIYLPCSALPELPVLAPPLPVVPRRFLVARGPDTAQDAAMPCLGLASLPAFLRPALPCPSVRDGAAETQGGAPAGRIDALAELPTWTRPRTNDLALERAVATLQRSWKAGLVSGSFALLGYELPGTAAPNRRSCLICWRVQRFPLTTADTYPFLSCPLGTARYSVLSVRDDPSAEWQGSHQVTTWTASTSRSGRVPVLSLTPRRTKVVQMFRVVRHL
jgi:hypothetical protein